MRQILSMRTTLCVLAIILPVRPSAGDDSQTLRHTVSLNGTWQIAEGSLDEQPQSFNRSVPVPGNGSVARIALSFHLARRVRALLELAGMPEIGVENRHNSFARTEPTKLTDRPSMVSNAA